MMSLTVAADVGRFEIDWDPEALRLILTERMQNCVVTLGGNLYAPPEKIIEWILDHDADISHAMGFYWLEFRDHLQRIFIE